MKNGMTENVVQIKPKKPAVLCVQCNCGSTTFRALTTGVLECSTCLDQLDDDITSVKYNEAVIAPLEYVRNTHDCGSADISFERIIRTAALPQTAAIVVMNNDGITRTWSDFDESDEHRAWFQRRVDILMVELCGVDTMISEEIEAANEDS